MERDLVPLAFHQAPHHRRYPRRDDQPEWERDGRIICGKIMGETGSGKMILLSMILPFHPGYGIFRQRIEVQRETRNIG